MGIGWVTDSTQFGNFKKSAEYLTIVLCIIKILQSTEKNAILKNNFLFN